jgi:hypothetical protein
MPRSSSPPPTGCSGGARRGDTLRLYYALDGGGYIIVKAVKTPLNHTPSYPLFVPLAPVILLVGKKEYNNA